MLFPFVHPSALGDAAKRLRASLESAPLEPFPLQLDHVGKFHNKSYDTVFLAPSATTQVQTLWKTVSSTAGYKGRPFAPHLTLGQARSEVQFARLEEKGTRMIRNHDLSWDVGSIAILIKDDADGGKMKIFEEMPLGASSFAPTAIVPERPLTYAVAEHGWTALPSSESPARTDAKLRVTTFNILNDDSHAPDVRFPLLKRDIFSHPSDILCLQEVPDAFLPLLLSDAEVRSRFTYCTCAPTSVLPHWQNVVVLSSIPFAWDPVALGDNQHKTASILTFAFPRPLVLAVVHFTAGHTPPLVAKRESEAASLVVHLRTHYAGAEWVILGDTNINTDWLPTTWSEAMDDAWSLCHPEESGVTYDPIKNALAAETSHEVKTPFRYDRICVQKRGQAQVERMQVVREAEGELPASDHWALWAELDVSSLADASAQSAAVASIAGSGASSQALPEDEDAALEAWVRANGGYPSEEQETARTQAIHTLRQVLGGALSDTVHAEQLMPAPLPPGVKLVFEPVGSRMLGVDTSSSDLDVLVIGNLGQDTFFGLMRARIRAWARACRAAQAPCTLVLRRFVRDATVPMMRLQVDGVEVDLQYAPAAKVAERWAEIARLPPDDPLFSLPASTLRVLNAYRDNVRLLSLLSADRLPQFRLALRALKIFTSVRGLAGAKLGYLGGVHLTLLLARRRGGGIHLPAHPSRGSRDTFHGTPAHQRQRGRDRAERYHHPKRTPSCRRAHAQRKPNVGPRLWNGR
jgi:2'-5' RNA ligase/endonuclease/exonuclease/phosphatase family metal-dependent hydrolase